MEKAIYPLIEGYQKFRKEHFEKDNSSFLELVRQGQRPKFLVIACSDSRVDPALVLNSKPGDLFVIRNVANLVPPYEDDHSYHGTSAALEFGIRVLGIEHIILFGHTQCGGIQGLLEHTHEKCGPRSFLTKWIELAKEAYDTTMKYHANFSLEEKVTFCGQQSLINSLKNLRTFPWITEKVDQGALRLRAWNFDMQKGILQEYDEKQNHFKDIGGKSPL